MREETPAQLEALVHVCRALGAEVRYHPEQGYFTAMLWKEWEHSFHAAAREIQRQIQKQTEQYPGLVCYCFDPFSTLVYAV